MKEIKDKWIELLIILMLLQWSTPFQAKTQPVIQWQHCLGGTKVDNAYSFKSTFDGGTIFAGESLSNDGDVTGHHGSADTLDIWIVKTDASGTIQWQKSFGGSSNDFSPAIVQTADSGFIFIASTLSNDGDITLNKGNSDVWVVKLDQTGNMQWQKSFGGSLYDSGRSIDQTLDGGYVVGAVTVSNDGDVSGNHGLTDLWIVKLDSTGAPQWQKCLGGTASDGLYPPVNSLWHYPDMSVFQTADSGYFVAGAACSNDGDLTLHHGSTANGYSDYWMVKLDNTGAIQWQQIYGGTQPDVISAALQTTDGGYIVAGSTMSNDVDVIGQHVNASGGNSWDIWIVKVDAFGVAQWKKTLGGTAAEHGYAIAETSDGGYFISGGTNSPNTGDVAGRRGGLQDCWIIKLDVAGELLWQKCMGGTGYENAFGGFQTGDGGYMVGGFTGSNNNDVTGNHSSGTSSTFGIYNDIWLVKLSAVSGNVMKGNIYEDLNANCIKDSAEMGLQGRIVKAMPGNYFATTDVQGNYTLFVDSGTYTVSHIPPQYAMQSCPALSGSYTVTINAASPHSFGNNFADTLTSHCADLTVSMSTSYLRACRKNSYIIHYKNTGAVDAVNVTLTVNFPAEIIPLSSSIPWTAPYVFNLDTVRAGKSGFIGITDSLSCNATVGDTLCATATISTTSSECDTTNNRSGDCHLVINSCDPNGLEVQSQVNDGGYVTQENITYSDSLTYLIRFQNIGNDTAFTVVVRDTLSQYLDAASIFNITTSHASTFRIYEQGICEWTFNNILLPDSATNALLSQGFIKFTVLQTAGNPTGTIIPNTAAIWFDYNQHITTNSTFNFIQSISSVPSLIHSEASALLYPNPFHSSATLVLNQLLQNAELIIFNVLGEEVRHLKNISSNVISLERGNWVNGIYGYRVVQGDKMILQGKFAVQ